jgi:hypothetical protein
VISALELRPVSNVYGSRLSEVHALSEVDLAVARRACGDHAAERLR